MTHKELLYLEDALKHEINIIGICNEMINLLEDEELASFIEKEVKKHEKMEKELLSKMEGLANDW